MDNKLETILQDLNSEPQDLSLEYLRKITEDFTNKRLLGEGGFGKVYKGVLQNGKIVAVKKLYQLNPGPQEKQFENEVYHLMRLKHPNIVRFIGYCYEARNECVEVDGNYLFAEKQQQRLLCLEYLPNGSLDGHLSDESSGLDWGTRYKIIKGICCGIHYLHEECKCNINVSIIHLDLKPANILLDDNMVPKIADFGLSRLFHGTKTQTCTTNLAGTFGYMAPEYIYRRVITTKADIYSLGVLIIEIIMGDRVDPFSLNTSSEDFIEHVLRNWRNRLQEAPSETDCNQIKWCLQMGIKCIRIDLNERPTAREIVNSLNEWESKNLKNKLVEENTHCYSDNDDVPPLPPAAKGSVLCERAGGSGGVASIVSEALFEQMLLHRNEESCPARDIDRAIALSLSDEEQRKAKAIGWGKDMHLEEDEQLARAIQESLNVESPPRRNGSANGGNTYHLPRETGNGGNTYQPPRENGPANGNAYHPLPFMFSSGFRACAGCHREIGHGRFLSCMGAVWHPECFRCHACSQPIYDYEFSMSGNHPYHKTCYKEQFHPKCDVCKQFIPTNMNGLIEYRAHPFWLQKYCPSHEVDGTPRCCSCERMEPRESRYVLLDDGRKLCLECLDSAVMDTNECQPLYLEIQEFYEGLNMKVEQQVPLLLVERQALNEAMEGEKAGHHHLPETRGLCLSEEQTVSTILRRPRMAGNKIMGMITEPYRLTRRCEVTAILILYGLPRLLTGSILAHEMMHAWMRLKGYRTLSPDVEEGICQVLAHLWIESEIMAGSGSSAASSSSGSSSSTSSKKGGRSQFERKLGDFFKHQIETDISMAYGEGFRAGNRAVLQYGLKRTLEHIRLTGTFPF